MTDRQREQEMPRFEPLAPDHPLIGKECVACQVEFAAGDVTTLVALGPGNDPDEQQRAREGRHYNAIAAPLHWACATGETV